MTSGFRYEVGENSVLLGHYAASSGIFVPTFGKNLSVPTSFLTPEEGTDRFFRNVGKELPLFAA
jgi:hypothetical protein